MSTIKESAREDAPATPPRRGRPLGSKNKLKPHDLTRAQPDRRLKPRADAAPPAGELPPPPLGLLADLQQALEAMSPRPGPATALAAALAVLAALAGSSYVVAGAPLSLYLAPAGEAGDEAAAGVARMVSALAPLAPAAADVIGPTTVGQPLTILRHFSRTPSQVCAWRGGATILRTMASRETREDVAALLTELWAAPLLTPAAAPDLRRPVHRPSLTILATGSAQDIADARASSTSPAHRFLSLPTTITTEQNHTPATTPPPKLLASLLELSRISQQLQAVGAVITVQVEPAARPALAIQPQPRAEIATRLAALAAIAADLYAPKLTAEHAAWAAALLKLDTAQPPTPEHQAEHTLQAQRAKQQERLLNRLEYYSTNPYSFCIHSTVTPQMHRDKVCTLGWIQQKLCNEGIFAKDIEGATSALKRTLLALIEAGKLEELAINTVKSRYARSSRCFVLVR